MRDTQIDHLRLRLRGLHGVDGRRLALLVSEGLLAAGLGADDLPDLTSLRVRIHRRRGEPESRLSGRIVREILQHLGESR